MNININVHNCREITKNESNLSRIDLNYSRPMLSFQYDSGSLNSWQKDNVLK